ncbi:M23 family metallopeptidase [Hymenobacter sp. 5317J-9]|uniref:M23 family metallopeptidase n=1 Tax=Hymenobacter sp. 5317J-9 TaxID=2932250 RepID=UPI001FD6D9BA|nr:peptidoglycan DD-metalloendopeptidase family protein [Hymenobacter sp. 5317J-9]UOQ96871.1 M23 family metallopeptidase [Hymenobacter sp. 5317J-9]
MKNKAKLITGVALALAAGMAGRVGGQEADTAERSRSTVSELLKAGRPTVAPGYFMFPIAPGKPNFLAGSMGELRPNHFHGGLDIKTGGGVNQPVYAAADGYVSRLKQSSFGYGNVLYITHPNGTTTVYGHLNEFKGAFAAELLRRQYDKQSYELEAFFEKDKYPVKRGELVALSGNTGGSAGPHLHWEVRDAQDRQYNPLQWGGFPEIQDHVAPQLQAFALEPLGIEARVKKVFAKAVFVPKVLPGPGVATTWADTISAFGTVGLLVQGFDRFDNAWNKNGIQRVTMTVNGQPFYEHNIDAVPFPTGTRQVGNFVDFLYQNTQGRTLQKLWVDDGNDLAMYTTGPSKGRLNVEAGKLYNIDITLADSYNNQTPVHLVVRGEQPEYFKTRSAAVKKTALRFEVTRNLLKAVVADPSADSVAANLTLLRGNRRLEIRPSYTQNSENVYLYDLRAGLPDSIRFGNITKKFDRQVMIPAGKETSYATNALTLVFGPETLFGNLYLSTSFKPEPTGSGFWTVGSPLQPLYHTATLTLKPATPPADPARTAIYAATAKGGKAYVGGKWDDRGQITAQIRQFASYRILRDTTAPRGSLIGRAGGQLSFSVGDDMSGLASYRLLIGGKFRMLRYEHKKALLFTVASDTLGPRLHGPAELRLTDQAGNERVIPLSL